MSAPVATSRPAPSAGRVGPRRRRRLIALVLVAVAGALLATELPHLRHAAREITLPLRHEDVIRQQAARKDLDAALIAAVIYAESHFQSNRISPAGAVGLMQLTPKTARAIASRTGGVAFTTADLATPQVNISYGSWYLRHLLQHFSGNTVAALAAYNAGIGNVTRWIDQAHARGEELTVDGIPYAETRAYVQRVLDARDRYHHDYRRELGL